MPFQVKNIIRESRLSPGTHVITVPDTPDLPALKHGGEGRSILKTSNFQSSFHISISVRNSLVHVRVKCFNIFPCHVSVPVNHPAGTYLWHLAAFQSSKNAGGSSTHGFRDFLGGHVAIGNLLYRRGTVPWFPWVLEPRVLDEFSLILHAGKSGSLFSMM